MYVLSKKRLPAHTVVYGHTFKLCGKPVYLAEVTELDYDEDNMRFISVEGLENTQHLEECLAHLAGDRAMNILEIGVADIRDTIATMDEMRDLCEAVDAEKLRSFINDHTTTSFTISDDGLLPAEVTLDLVFTVQKTQSWLTRNFGDLSDLLPLMSIGMAFQSIDITASEKKQHSDIDVINVLAHLVNGEYKVIYEGTGDADVL
jgi:hypothetical protein